MKFPPYGRALWMKRLLGARPRVVALLVGDHWRTPKPVREAGIPRLGVHTALWHERRAERYDWRCVAACTVLAYDQRLPDERAQGPLGWDSWLWLLADVHRYASDVLMITPTVDFRDRSGTWALERYLDIYAFLNRSIVDGTWTWPPWWPYGALLPSPDGFLAPEAGQ